MREDVYIRCRPWRLFNCLILLLLVLAPTSSPAAATTTLVNDVVYRADGTPARGTLVISWPAFTTADNLAVAAGSMSVAIATGGAVSLGLVPNSGGTPAGTYYKVVYKLDDGSTSEEYWSVPDTATTTISAIRSRIVPANVAMQVASRQYVDSALAALGRAGVTSFNGRTAAVLPLANDYAYNQLRDVPLSFPPEAHTHPEGVNASQLRGREVDAATPSRGDELYFDGGKWLPRSKGGVVDCRDYGVKGDGVTDDTAAAQAWWNAWGDYMEATCPVGYRIKITSTLQDLGRLGQRLTCKGTGFTGYTGGCSIEWAGPDGGTVIDLARVRDMVWDGFAVYMRHPQIGTSANGADTGILLRNDVTNPHSNNAFCSANIFKHGAVYLNSNREGILVYIGDPSGQNCEFMRFERWSLYGGMGAPHGTGIYQLHANVKSTDLDWVGCSQLNTCVNNIGGSFNVKNGAGYNTNCIYGGNGGTEPIEILSDNYEITRGVVCMATGSGSMHIKGSRYAMDAAATQPPFQIGGVALTIEDTKVTALPAGLNVFSATVNSSVKLKNLNTGRPGMDPGLTGARVVIEDLVPQGDSWERGGSFAFASPTNNGTIAGWHFRATTGLAMRGLFVQPDSSGAAPCPANTRCLAEGQIEIGGVPPASRPKLSLVGTPGSSSRILYLVAKDASGNRSLVSEPSTIYNAPATLSAQNYVTIDNNYAVPGAASFDVLAQCSGGTYSLIAASATLPYNIQAEPACPGSYSLPAYNETGSVKIRGPLLDRTGNPIGGGGGSSYSNLFQADGNTLEQRNGASAQAFRLYNTYTDAANYERAFLRWSSNIFQIGTELGGSGTPRDMSVGTFTTGGGTLRFVTGGTVRMEIDSSNGHWKPGGNGTQDLGASGNKFGSVYAKGSYYFNDSTINSPSGGGGSWMFAPGAGSNGNVYFVVTAGKMLFGSGADLGGASYRWGTVYGTNGNFTKLLGITDTAEVANLNVQKWHGKDALDFSATLDFGSIVAHSCSTLTVTVTGAAAGNPVAPAWPATLEAGLTGIMLVSATDTVSVRLCNVTGDPMDPAAQTFGGRVIK